MLVAKAAVLANASRPALPVFPLPNGLLARAANGLSPASGWNWERYSADRLWVTAGSRHEGNSSFYGAVKRKPAAASSTRVDACRCRSCL